MISQLLLFFSVFFSLDASASINSRSAKTTLQAFVKSNTFKVAKLQKNHKLKTKKTLNSLKPKKDLTHITPKVVEETLFKTWIIQLIEIQKTLSGQNFKKALNETVCPQLKALETKSYKNSNASDQYFEQLVKFYGSITKYTLNHSYYYCLASFLNDPQHKLIELVSNDLPKNQKTQLLDRLNVCYQESSEGNGDVAVKTLPLKSLKGYSNLDNKSKINYINKLKDSYIKTEEANLNKKL